MAHGYLTPTKVGEKDIFRTVGDLLDRFKKEGDKNGAPPEGGSDLAVVQKAGKSKVYKQARTSNEKEQKNVNLLVTQMGGVLSNMISRGSNEEQSIGGTKKGGSFVNMGASTKPISDTTFFKSAVVEGVNPLTGEYYSPEERIAAFKKYRPNERTTQGVGVSGGGAAEIVAALARNTAAVIRMEDAVNRQTDNDTRIAINEIQAQDTVFNRLLAAQKENRLEQGSDFSGSRRPLPVGGSRRGGGGGGGRGGFGGLGGNAGQIASNVFDLTRRGKLGGKVALEGLSKAGKPIRAATNIVATVTDRASKALQIDPKAIRPLLNQATKARNFIKNPLTAFKYGQAMADAARDMAEVGLFKGIKNVDTKFELLKGIGGGAKAMNKSLAAIYAGGGSIDDFTKVLLSGGMPADELIEAGTNKGVVSGFKKFSQDADKIAKNLSPDAAKAITPSRINQLDNAGVKVADIVTDQVVKKGVKQGLKKGSALTRLMVKNFGAAGTRSIFKKIPVVAGLAGIAFGIQRAIEGDFLGAGLEITSGLLGAISPLTGGAGTGASFAIDGYLLARDLGLTPLKDGIIADGALPAVFGEKGKEAAVPLEGSEGEIAGSVFGKASGEALANFFKKKPLEKLRYNSDHPEGINQPNPHPPGTFLYRNFERLRQMHIIDPDMKISQSHNFMPRNTNKGTAIANSSAEVASGDRKNNSGNNTVIMESPAGTDNKGNSGLPLTSNPAGGSEDQGLSMYAAHLVMASV